MKKRNTPVIHIEPEVIDLEQLIYISDSDDEILPKPTPIQKYTTPSTVIAIDDDSDSNSDNNDQHFTNAKVKLYKSTVLFREKSNHSPSVIVKKSVDNPASITGSQKKIVKSVIQQTPTSNASKPNLHNNKLPFTGKGFASKIQDTIVPNAKTEPLVRTMDSPASSPASMLHLPKKWSSSSSQALRVEVRASNALLLKASVSSEERKLSLPRSALLKKSTLGKCPSSIIKAASPLRNTSLKRPMESPERPHRLRSGSSERPSPLVFDTTIHRAPEITRRFDLFEWPSQSDIAAAMDTTTQSESPEKEPPFQRSSKKINIDIRSLPNREPVLRQPNAVNYGSPNEDTMTGHSLNQKHNPVYGLPDRGNLPQCDLGQASKTIHGYPNRETPIQRASRKTNANVHGFPERESPTQCASQQADCPIYVSPERFTCFLSSPSIDHSSEIRKPKTSSSPFSRPTFQKPKVVHELYDEDGKEEDLGLFVSIMTSTRRKLQPNKAPKSIQMQCPICYLLYPKNELDEHAIGCLGDADIVGNKRGIRKNTIGAAVEMDESERKRLNKGKIDTGPTNYYADGESVLALDGVGFNAAASSISWESAGQTRFG